MLLRLFGYIIQVITAASDPADAKANGEYYVGLFEKYGAKSKQIHPI